MTTSNSKQRVLIERDVFGKSVAGTRTGREMSTPDTHMPALHEIDLDGSHGLVWLPDVVLMPLSYVVSVSVEQECHASPTDAVLTTIEWLRSNGPGEIHFTVESSDDNVQYDVAATCDDNDVWTATVVDATAPNYDRSTQSQQARVRRDDLIPTQE